jgi:hypothetical protein
MAFTSAVLGTTVFGNKRVKWGTFTTSSTDTGGDIATGLTRVDMMLLQHSGASDVDDAPAVNETFPLSGGDVTIVHTASADGYWLAIGDD